MAAPASGLALLFATVCVAGCSGVEKPFSQRRPAFEPGTGLVVGVISSPAGTPLSPDAVLRLMLVRLPAPGAEESIVAESRQRLGTTRLPIRFWLEFPWLVVDTSAAYALRGEIRNRGRDRLASRATQRVLTGGYPSMLELVVEPVGESNR